MFEAIVFCRNWCDDGLNPWKMLCMFWSCFLGMGFIRLLCYVVG
jgi:hypothetical protein